VTSLANIPGEARCKQLVYRLPTNQSTHTMCGRTLSWKQTYGWCRTCRTKVRPKAATWFRGCKLSYRQLFLLLWCFQNKQSPGTTRLVTGPSYTTIARWYWRFRAQLPAAVPELEGIVEVDESFFGKQRYGHQAMVVGAIERDTRRLRLRVIPDRAQDTLE
jgi:hypothetical protein